MARVVRASQREVIIFCDCRAECLIEYFEKGKLIDKTKYDEDGEPYMED